MKRAEEKKTYTVKALNEPDPKKIARFFVECAIELGLIEDPSKEHEKARAVLGQIRARKEEKK